jgi:hypothetical protein
MVHPHCRFALAAWHCAQVNGTHLKVAHAQQFLKKCRWRPHVILCIRYDRCNSAGGERLLAHAPSCWKPGSSPGVLNSGDTASGGGEPTNFRLAPTGAGVSVARGGCGCIPPLASNSGCHAGGGAPVGSIHWCIDLAGESNAMTITTTAGKRMMHLRSVSDNAGDTPDSRSCMPWLAFVTWEGGGSTTGGRPGAASSDRRAPKAASSCGGHSASEAVLPVEAVRGAPGVTRAMYSSRAAPVVAHSSKA